MKDVFSEKWKISSGANNSLKRKQTPANIKEIIVSDNFDLETKNGSPSPFIKENQKRFS